MKFKAIAIAIAMVAGTCAANAQATYKGHDVFVGVGAGVISTYNDGFNSPAVYGQIQVGKMITPVWGVRGVIGGPFQTLDENTGNAYYTAGGSTHYAKDHKIFGELNLDGIINISNIFADDLAKWDFYVFAGPTVNLSAVGTEFTGEVAYDSAEKAYMTVEKNFDDLKARVGATAGLGLDYNFTNTFALGVEGRFGVTPSIFGDASQCRKAEGTGRVTINGVWTIGGKHGKLARAAAAAAAAGYISREAAEALAAEAVAKNPKIVEKIVEKEVEKPVDHYITTAAPTSTAVFFNIGKTNLTDKDKARLNLFAEGIKATNDDTVYEVAGYADKATGSTSINQKLSEGRANTVYNYLVEQGVPESKLQKQAYGGVDPIFFNSNVLSRAVIVKGK